MRINKLHRSLVVLTILLMSAAGLASVRFYQPRQPQSSLTEQQKSLTATGVLHMLAVSAPASKAGYSRKQFSDGWAKIDTCTVRDKVLARDMTEVRYLSPMDCTVLSGLLKDPYTGKTIHFFHGPNTSAAVQIDHVVAISDAWQTGAQQLAKSKREQLYNDSLELLAVDGPANEEKGDSDAAGWLPPNTDYDCRYVARQIAVKFKYHLWVTPPERLSMEKVLKTCPEQLVPSAIN